LEEYWDQWLVWKARETGAAVVDASEAVLAVHQNHDYGYSPAGKTGVWTDAGTEIMSWLAGGGICERLMMRRMCWGRRGW